MQHVEIAIELGEVGLGKRKYTHYRRDQELSKDLPKNI